MGLLIFLGILVLVTVLIVLIVVIYNDSKKKRYPSKTIKVDITNKRITSENDALDYYIVTYGTSALTTHFYLIKNWKDKFSEKYKNKPKKLKKFNDKANLKSINAFVFVFVSYKTRYRQVNYQRYPYKVEEIRYKFRHTDDYVANRIKFLKDHNYYVTYSNYTKIDQRKALTKELREYIKKRDNYTCQICGKHMPDEVGLHIDHIVPVSRGGKSIPENLRVLCSKCNGRKGNK